MRYYAHLCVAAFLWLYCAGNLSAQLQWQSTSGPLGGNVRSFTTHQSAVFAGTGSGLFRSTDNGQSWSPVGKSLAGNSVTDLASTPRTLFAILSYSLFRSDDNGTTWTFVSMPIGASSPSSVVANGNTVYVGTENGSIIRSSDGGSSWVEAIRVQGDTVRTFSGIPTLASHSIRGIDVHGSTVMAITSRGRLLRSVDQGLNWITSTPQQLAPSQDAFSSSLSSNLVLTDSVLVVGLGNGFLRSTNNGATWQSIPQIYRVNRLFKQNAQTILAATSQGIMRSTNTGLTWTNISSGLGDRPINVIGLSGDKLFVGTEGIPGVFASADNGQSWSISNAGMIASSITNVVASPTSLFAVSNGLFLRSADNGTTWTVSPIVGGSSIGVWNVAVRGSEVFIATSTGIFRSTDDGRNWTLSVLANNVFNTNAGLFALSSSTIYQSSNGINWIQLPRIDSLYYGANEVIANSSAILVGASDRILRTTNNGATWQIVWRASTTGSFTQVNSLALGESMMFAGVSNGFYRSADSGATWQRIGLANQNVVKVFVYASTVFAANRNGDIFYSSDDGLTWANADFAARNTSITSFTGRGSTLYVGTSNQGMFRASTTPVPTNTPCLTTFTGSLAAFSDRTTNTVVYNNNLDCRWLIKPTTAPGRIVLTFTRFSTEDNYDFVTVYDGETTTSPQIGRFSGAYLPLNLIARSGAMLIRFSTDSSAVSSGWTATYNVIANSTQAFAPPTALSPNGLVLSNRFQSFNLRFNAEVNSGDFIRLQIASDSLFTNVISRFDFVAGGYYPNQFNYSFGYSLPSSATPGNRYFWRVAHTSDTALANRWSVPASFTLAPPSCSGTTTLTANTGSITDRTDGLSNYTDNLDCSWLIRPANGGRITLSFSRFSTESCCDAVTVYDGATINSQILGTFRGSSIPAAITSSGGVMLVRFTTDGSSTSTGWAASYTAGGATPPDTTASTARELRIPTVSVAPGSIAVPVMVSGLTAAQNVLSCQMTVSFDTTRIRLTGVTVAGTIADSSIVTVNVSTPGRLVFTLFRARPFSGNGVFLNLIGTTVVSAGQTSVGISNAVLNEGSPSVSASGGTVTIGGFLCGDVSRNGTITALDASLVAEHAIGLRRLTGDSLRAADVSGNRQVTGYDAALIAQFAVGLVSSFPNGCPTLLALASILKEGQTASLTSDNPLTLSIETPRQQSGRRYSIPIRLTNTHATDIRAYSFSLRYDPSIVNITATALDETLSAGGTLILNTTEAGIVRGVYFNTRGFSASGTLLNILADGQSSGSSTLTLENTMVNEGSPTVRVQNGAITVQQVTSVRSQLEQNSPASLSAFPTPATDMVNFSLSLTKAIPATLVISTMLGQEVARVHDGNLSTGSHQFTWNVQNLPSGVYVASLQSAGTRLNSVLVQIVR